MRSRVSPVIRVFVSSTFSDFKQERNILQMEVFPRLEHYCFVHGFQFQAIDLRWGIPGEAGRAHRTMELCFEELRRAQEVSPRPNFLILLGDRYGWRPLAETVTEDEFRTLERAATALDRAEGRDRGVFETAADTLRSWYRRDDNAVPAEYLLRSRNEWPGNPHWPEEQERVEWARVEGRLWQVINQAFPPGDLADRFGHLVPADQPLPSIVKFQCSATEQEIWRGALTVPDAPDHVVAWYRNIRNQAEFRADERARDFLDSDESLHGAAMQLRDELFRRLQKRGEDGLQPVEADLRPGDGSEIQVSGDHLQAMCREIEMRLRRLVDREIANYWRPGTGAATSATPETAPAGPDEACSFELEQEAQELFAERYAAQDGFVGREKELAAIAAYLEDRSDCKPLVIFGRSGIGKTALVARAAQLAATGDRRIAVRFLGATPQSSNLRGLLANLCCTLQPAGQVKGDLPVELRDLEEEFQRLLALATEAHPILLFLDALDQLDEADGARELHWLRTPLPPHVKVVVSCLRDDEGDTDLKQPYRALERRRLLDRAIAVFTLSAAEAIEALDRWFEQTARGRRARRLSRQQRAAIEARVKPDSATACRFPLFLRVLFEEARLWPSWKEVKAEELGASLGALLQGLFERLESPSMHGRALVEAALGSIVSARRGLSENELLEAMWADPGYKQHLEEESRKNRHELPPDATRIPVIIWSRLRHDLEPYLAEHTAPGGVVITIYQHEVARAIARRFLADASQRCRRHRRLAEYFESDRQPWWTLPDDAPNAGQPLSRKRFPNARKADELPYQWLAVAKSANQNRLQAEGASAQDAIEALFQQLAFLEAKAEAGMVFDLVADFAAAAGAILYGRPGQRVLRLLHRALRRDASLIASRPHLLLQCLWHTCYWHDSPRTPEHCAWQNPDEARNASWPWNHAGPKMSQLLSRWLAEARRDESLRLPWLRSCRPGGTPLDSPLLTLLRGNLVSGMAVAVTADGLRIITGGGSQRKDEVFVWDAESGTLVAALRGHEEFISCVAVTPDGRRIISGSGDQTVRVWDGESGAALAVLRGHQGFILSVAVTPDGRRIVSGSGHCPPAGPKGKWGEFFEPGDNTVRVWDGDTGAELITLRGHRAEVRSVAVTSDGKTVISGSDDGTVRVWNVEKGEERAALSGHMVGVNGVAVVADRRVLSVSADSMRLWDIRTCSQVRVFPKREPAFHSLAVTADGRRVVGGCGNNVRVCDIDSGADLAVFSGHQHDIGCLAVTPDGRRIVSGSNGDEGICVWEADIRVTPAPLRGHSDAVVCAALTPDGKRIVSAGKDFTLRVWDSDRGAELAILRGHERPIRCVAVTSDGQRIVTGADDNTVRIWDCRGGAELAILRGHTREIRGVAVTPDGRRVVSGSGGWEEWSGCRGLERIFLKTWDAIDRLRDALMGVKETETKSLDNTVRIWDGESGAQLRVLRGHKGNVECVAITADARRIVSGGGTDDETVQVWDGVSGARVAVVRGSASATDVAVTPDGRLLAAGFHDGAVVLCNAESGERLMILRGHRKPVQSVAVSPDGKVVLAAAVDGLTLLWNVDGPARNTAERAGPAARRFAKLVFRKKAGMPPEVSFAAAVYWPGALVRICESHEYAAVAWGKELIPCKVEAVASLSPPRPPGLPAFRTAALNCTGAG